jgi:hypothetical protein
MSTFSLNLVDDINRKVWASAELHHTFTELCSLSFDASDKKIVANLVRQAHGNDDAYDVEYVGYANVRDDHTTSAIGSTLEWLDDINRDVLKTVSDRLDEDCGDVYAVVLELLEAALEELKEADEDIAGEMFPELT